MDACEGAAGSTLQPVSTVEPTINPLIRAAGWGTVVGALLGLLTGAALVIPWSGIGPGTGGGVADVSIGEVSSGAVILTFAGFVGLCFGGLTGLIAGFGAVLVPERGLRRRLAVCGLALGVVVTTAAVLDAAWGPSSFVLELALCLLVPAAVASWFLAPRLTPPRSQ